MRAAITPGQYGIPATGTLAERTRTIVAAFDREEKDYAFNDSGDGTTYAEWFADLLDEWLAS